MNRSDGITEHNQWRLIFQAFNMRNAITCTKIKLKKERKINCLPIFDHPVIQQISKKKKKKKRANEKRRVKTILELTNKLQKRKKKNQNRLSHSPYLIPCSTNQNMPPIKVIPIYIYIYIKEEDHGPITRVEFESNIFK